MEKEGIERRIEELAQDTAGLPHLPPPFPRSFPMSANMHSLVVHLHKHMPIHLRDQCTAIVLHFP